MALNAISKEKHSPRRHEGHEEKQKRLTFFWFPSSSLGTTKPKLQLSETGSWRLGASTNIAILSSRLPFVSSRMRTLSTRIGIGSAQVRSEGDK
jgi:hypothetical protein